MKFFCRHCEKIAFGRSYRVISQEDGVTLLDMTVCHSCYEQAKALGLHSEAIPLDRKQRRQRRPWANASA
jgi:hypothetical protein